MELGTRTHGQTQRAGRPSEPGPAGPIITKVTRASQQTDLLTTPFAIAETLYGTVHCVTRSMKPRGLRKT